MVRTWVIGAVVLTLWTAAAQATAHAIINEALSLDDVRRPVYRGNVRYNISISNNLVKEIVEREQSRSKYALDVIKGIQRKRNSNGNHKRINSRMNIFSNSTIKSSNNNVSHNTEPKSDKIMVTGKKIDNNISDEIWSQVQLTTDLNQTKMVEKFLENSLNDWDKSSESLDKLILSHTEAGDKHIQMYPEGSPPDWSDEPEKANVILIEDVHPSKLPKPQYTQIALYHTPTRPSGTDNYDNFEPTKPSWSNLNSLSSKPVRPHDTHAPNGHDYTRPPVGKPSHFYGAPTTKPSHYYEPVPTKPSPYYEPVPTKPPHHYEPIPTKPSILYDFPKPVVSVHQYPELFEPTFKPTEPSKPVYIHSKPLTIKPVFEHNTEPSYRPVMTTTSTHLPKPILISEVVTQYTPIYIKPPPEPPPKRPPPPTIVVIESPSDNHIDCGTVQVINFASFKECPDVTVVLNASSNTNTTTSAATNTSAAPQETHAALVPAASPGSGLNGIVGVVPIPPPPLPIPPLRPPSSIIPVQEEDEEDEEYDYEDELDDDLPSTSTTSTTTAAPSRPHQSTSLLSYLMTSLPFIGPISVSLWIILLGPLSFILIGVMGVASFLIPWIAPSILRIG